MKNFEITRRHEAVAIGPIAQRLIEELEAGANGEMSLKPCVEMHTAEHGNGNGQRPDDGEDRAEGRHAAAS